MNAFKVAGRPGDYTLFRENILRLVEALRNDCGKTVFCAIEDIQDVKKFDLPGASLALDIDKVQEHEFFILLCMRDVLSKSVLIEMGMALAMGKKCIICVQRGADLPFILHDAASAIQHVKAIDFETIDDLIFEVTKNTSWIFNFERKGVHTSNRKSTKA